MSIKYRQDSNLMFLKFCDNDDLKVLIDILIGKDNQNRFSEELSFEPRYKNCKGNYAEIWDLIAGELQLFGGDSIASMFRGGKGVLYDEILRDVCKKLKIKPGADVDIQEMENQLILKVLEKSFEKMNENEREEFANFTGISVKNLAPHAMVIALQAAIRAGGFVSYKIAAIVANSVAKAITGHGLRLAANAGLMRGIALFAGPIGWALNAFLCVPLISAPAYRVTVSACIQVAYMRNKYINKDFL